MEAGATQEPPLESRVRAGFSLKRRNIVIRSINPTTEEMLAEFEEFTPERFDTVLIKTQHAFEHWNRTSFDERTTLMGLPVSFLRQHKKRLAGVCISDLC